jgi:hypothetical protein
MDMDMDMDMDMAIQRRYTSKTPAWSSHLLARYLLTAFIYG